MIVVLFEGDGTYEAAELRENVAQAINDQCSVTPWRVQEVGRDSLFKTTSGKISRELNRAGWIAEGFTTATATATASA